jgi:uncharacterized membrane protein YphA (DoxX/SURF4 family)
MKKAYTIIEWTLSIALGITFLIAASGKFSFEGNMYENFIRWGYNGVLLVAVGIMEGLGGILLFITKLRNYGAYFLILVMIGASVTHIVQLEELGWPVLPLSLILALIAILFIRKKTSKLNAQTDIEK